MELPVSHCFYDKSLKYTRDYFSLIIYDEIKNNFSIIMRLKICYNKKKESYGDYL